MGRFPQKDEALSSWLARRLCQLGLERRVFDETLSQRYPSVAAAFVKDPDFPKGRLWRGAMAGLLGVSVSSLQGIGSPSSPWFLMPGCRRSACLACLAQAPYVTAQYVREQWLQSWRTICSVHHLPLVEVPAVGAAWAQLPRATRKMHGRSMRRPDHNASWWGGIWMSMPSHIREAVIGAEMRIADAWREYFINGPGELSPSGSIVVWRDLLAFSTSSWDTVTAPPVATQVLPPYFSGLEPVFFRFPNVAPCTEPDFHMFRALTNPATRRVCMLAVMEAMHDVLSSGYIRPMQRQTWGWRWVLSRIPGAARDWLQRKSENWPDCWRATMERWLSDGSLRR